MTSETCLRKEASSRQEARVAKGPLVPLVALPETGAPPWLGQFHSRQHQSEKLSADCPVSHRDTEQRQAAEKREKNKGKGRH